MSEHPFTSKDGLYCDLCNLPAANATHYGETYPWNDDGSHALVTGWVMMALHMQASSEQIVEDVSPVMDGLGNYTNAIRVTTRSGNVYQVTVTPTQ